MTDVRSGSDVTNPRGVGPGRTLSGSYGHDIDVMTEPFAPARYRNAAGCRRLEPLRGAPTVEQADAVWLFTDDVVVRLGNMAVGYEPALVDVTCGANPGEEGGPGGP